MHKITWFARSVLFIGIFLALILALATFYFLKEISEAKDWVDHTFKVENTLKQHLSYLKDAETGQRGFLITNDSVFLEPYFKGSKELQSSYLKLDSLLVNNKEQQNNLNDLKLLNDKLFGRLQIIFGENYTVSGTSANMNAALVEAKKVMDAIRLKVGKMIQFQQNLLKERQKTHATYEKLIPTLLVVLLIIFALLLTTAYLRIFKDVEALKEVNEELAIFKKNTKQAEIINKHGSWLWNINTGEFSFSDNLYRLLGASPKSFEPSIENFMKYVHPEDVPKLTEQTNQMMVDEDLPFIYYRVVHDNGTIRYLKAYGKKIISDTNDDFILGTTTDITDDVDRLKELEDNNLQLMKSVEELEAFNYVASHDLQEPLRKIQFFLSRLHDTDAENLSNKGKQLIEKMDAAAVRMRDLIDDLLQYSQASNAGKNYAEVEMNPLLKEVLEDLEDSFNLESAHISMTDMPTIHAIPFQIKQLFFNLISNALKYSAKNRQVHIAVDYKEITEAQFLATIPANSKALTYHQFSVTDNGIGFNDAYADKVFELFKRLHVEEHYTGTGIGLSICKKIVENHKGYIGVKSKVDEGTTFTIQIPANL